MSETASLPAPGQIARIRQRTYLVEQVVQPKRVADSTLVRGWAQAGGTNPKLSEPLANTSVTRELAATSRVHSNQPSTPPSAAIFWNAGGWTCGPFVDGLKSSLSPNRERHTEAKLPRQNSIMAKRKAAKKKRANKKPMRKKAAKKSAPPITLRGEDRYAPTEEGAIELIEWVYEETTTCADWKRNRTYPKEDYPKLLNNAVGGIWWRDARVRVAMLPDSVARPRDALKRLFAEPLTVENVERNAVLLGPLVSDLRRTWENEKVERWEDGARITPSRTKEGVSLLDVALLLNDGEIDSATHSRKRWQNSRNVALPPKLGADDADGLSALYSLSDLLEFVEEIERLQPAAKSDLRRKLRPKLRPVRLK